MKVNIRKIWCTVALTLATVGAARPSWAQLSPAETWKLVPPAPPTDRRICPDGSIAFNNEPCPTVAFDLFGTLFDDANGDRVQNTGEGGLASWNVLFFGLQQSGAVVQEQARVSSASGEFSVSFIDGGSTDWYLEVTAPAGWEPTGTPVANTTYVFRIEPGLATASTGVRLDRSFGFREVGTGAPGTPPVSVPEPTTLALLGIGGVIMGVTRRRSQRRATLG